MDITGAGGDIPEQDAVTLETPQPDNSDPLLECLVFLTKYHDRPTSPESLRTGLLQPHQRFTIDTLIRASERAGFVAEVVEWPQEKVSNVIMPCIALLKNGEACVLLKREKMGFTVMSPPMQNASQEISDQALDEMSTGQYILLQPKFHFDKRSDVLTLPRPREWFWGTIIGNWRIYGLALMGTVMVNLFVLASPLFVMTVYDRVVPNTAFETLWVLALGVLGVSLFDFLVKTMRAYFIDAVGKRTDFIISTRVFEQILGLQMASKQKSSGVMANTLREFEAIRDFFTSATLTTVGDFPFVFLFIFVIWLIGGPLAYIPLVAVPLVLIVSILIQIPLAEIIKQSFTESAQKNAHLFEVLNSIETIKGSGIEGWAMKHWEKYVGKTAMTQMKSRMISSLAVHFAQAMLLLTSVAIVIFGVYEIDAGNMTLGTLIACMILNSRAMAPLIQVASLLVRYQQSRASLNALHNIMTMPVERPEDKRFVQRTKLEGDIEFRDVTFGYPDEPIEALKKATFNIRRGEKVGVVGRIGAGKSTILKVIMGLYPPNSGACLVDGIDIRQLDPIDLRRNIGYVQQDTQLFFGSVRDNITFGAPYVDDATILKASAIAGVDYFVKQHPHGFEQPVGEKGESLSGGQRQAITIARALLLEPPILLLDEPTGQMDHTSEKNFLVKLHQYARDKTMIIVTHRTSLLQLVDRLIVMDKGEIVADGPKDKVLQALVETGSDNK